jgi:hypothetical protein
MIVIPPVVSRIETATGHESCKKIGGVASPRSRR